MARLNRFTVLAVLTVLLASPESDMPAQMGHGVLSLLAGPALAQEDGDDDDDDGIMNGDDVDDDNDGIVDDDDDDADGDGMVDMDDDNNGLDIAPAGTSVVIFLDDQNEIIDVTDPIGTPLETCQLCTTQLELQYGPGCDQLIANPALDPSIEICESTTDVTINDINPIETLITRQNPRCYSFFQRSLGRIFRVWRICR